MDKAKAKRLNQMQREKRDAKRLNHNGNQEDKERKVEKAGSDRPYRKALSLRPSIYEVPIEEKNVYVKEIVELLQYLTEVLAMNPSVEATDGSGLRSLYYFLQYVSSKRTVRDVR
ncbi:hypothetical protein E1B28_007554 [Marasmius oreades]|uniref:Uncharacterized protein n=1 Tax=Marasmius oreades TaxID=181124 RepID=A0A9P7S2J7_9AGAR|nr:uncharacterized protein E1B28_007546 [Marasmius oreades]XP_043010388.1 uncharacterized protein E1B28_007554 [Marasmius oreades]KAG7093910.1 hypothetical protein E1B28_007546 [Marasmius oreades]KAG7093918.1 hypothetical protein E1B28_007554 [Marasmius oreades]